MLWICTGTWGLGNKIFIGILKHSTFFLIMLGCMIVYTNIMDLQQFTQYGHRLLVGMTGVWVLVKVGYFLFVFILKWLWSLFIILCNR